MPRAPSRLSSSLASSAPVYLECPFSPQSSGLSEGGPLEIRMAPRSFSSRYLVPTNRPITIATSKLSATSRWQLKLPTSNAFREESASLARSTFLSIAVTARMIARSARRSIRRLCRRGKNTLVHFECSWLFVQFCVTTLRFGAQLNILYG